jgi:hypothetical protein
MQKELRRLQKQGIIRPYKGAKNPTHFFNFERAAGDFTFWWDVSSNPKSFSDILKLAEDSDISQQRFAVSHQLYFQEFPGGGSSYILLDYDLKKQSLPPAQLDALMNFMREKGMLVFLSQSQKGFHAICGAKNVYVDIHSQPYRTQFLKILENLGIPIDNLDVISNQHYGRVTRLPRSKLQPSDLMDIKLTIDCSSIQKVENEEEEKKRYGGWVPYCKKLAEEGTAFVAFSHLDKTAHSSVLYFWDSINTFLDNIEPDFDDPKESRNLASLIALRLYQPLERGEDGFNINSESEIPKVIRGKRISRDRNWKIARMLLRELFFPVHGPVKGFKNTIREFLPSLDCVSQLPEYLRYPEGLEEQVSILRKCLSKEILNLANHYHSSSDPDYLDRLTSCLTWSPLSRGYNRDSYLTIVTDTRQSKKGQGLPQEHLAPDYQSHTSPRDLASQKYISESNIFTERLQDVRKKRPYTKPLVSSEEITTELSGISDCDLGALSSTEIYALIGHRPTNNQLQKEAA